LILDLIDRGFLRFFRNNACRGYRKKRKQRRIDCFQIPKKKT